MKDSSGHIPVVLDNYSLKAVLPLTDTNAYNIICILYNTSTSLRKVDLGIFEAGVIQYIEQKKRPTD